MEYVLNELLQTETEFYLRRTNGEPLEKLKDLFPNTSYKDSEVVRKDKFLHVYMGKDYGGRAYELVSMGFQYAYTNPALLLKDPDMAEWIFGILCLL